MYGRPAGAYGAGAYGAGSMYGSGYGSSMYGSPYGGYGGNSMYGGGGYSPYSGSAYGRPGYGGGAMMGGAYGAGGGVYGASPWYSGGAGFGGPPGQPAIGPVDGPHAPGGPGAPGQHRTKWQVFMESINGLMHFFGRVSFLMDENAHAVHFFITALLQMLERASFLWGEIARFVLRLLGFKYARKAAGQSQHAAGQAAHQAPAGQLPSARSTPRLPAPHAAPPRQAGLEAAWPG